MTFGDGEQRIACPDWSCKYSRAAISAAFCVHVARSGKPLVVPDATEDPRFSGNILVRAYPGIRFYAGVPVLGDDGDVLAVLSVIDYEPRQGLSSDEVKRLGELADLAARGIQREAIAQRPWRTGDGAPGDGPATKGEPACLVVDGTGSIINWNAAAEELFAAYADDLFRTSIRHHLPTWEHLVKDLTDANAGPAPPGRPRTIPIIRSGGVRAVAAATVTRTVAGGVERYHIVLVDEGARRVSALRAAGKLPDWAEAPAFPRHWRVIENEQKRKTTVV